MKIENFEKVNQMISISNEVCSIWNAVGIKEKAILEKFKHKYLGEGLSEKLDSELVKIKISFASKNLGNKLNLNLLIGSDLLDWEVNKKTYMKGLALFQEQVGILSLNFNFSSHSHIISRRITIKKKQE